MPHPLQFNKPRTTTGDIADAKRREVGQHFMVGWNFRSRGAADAARGLDFTLFAGPSIFVTDQLFVNSLMLSLEKEVFPFDELAFPGAQTETLRENVLGYNAGVDMTWRFTENVGVGLLLRTRTARKNSRPQMGSRLTSLLGDCTPAVACACCSTPGRRSRSAEIASS